MTGKVTPERIISISKKLNIYMQDFSMDNLLNSVLDKIEELAAQSGWRYNECNQEVIQFYRDCQEEMEALREYEDTFI